MNITLTAQIGGPDASGLFRNYIVKLRKSLKLLEDKTYSESIEKVKVFLRISGRIENYPEPTGIYNFRYNKKNKIYSAEIIISVDSWKKNQDIKQILSDLTKEFFNSLSDYLARKKINLDSSSLLNDIENIVLANYKSTE